MHFEREFGPGAYAIGSAFWTGATICTTKTGFWPMFKVARGIRNKLPGAGAGGGGSPTAAAPAAVVPVAGAGEMAVSVAHSGDEMVDIARGEDLISVTSDIPVNFIDDASELDETGRTTNVAASLEDIRATQEIPDDPARSGVCDSSPRRRRNGSSRSNRRQPV